MIELERQQVTMIRQVVKVQLRRMLNLLEKIKLSNPEVAAASKFLRSSPKYIRNLVHTCAEAILIQINVESMDPMSATIKECLTPDEFYGIVFTWAEELRFEQACSGRVLAQIFAEFDVDGDGLVSEADLQVKIERLVFKAPLKESDQAPVEASMSVPESLQDLSSQDKSLLPIATNVLPMPEQLELVLDESEEASVSPSQRQDLQVQFESDGLPSHRTGGSSKTKVDTLLRLKKGAINDDLINIVQELAESRGNTGHSKALSGTQDVVEVPEESNEKFPYHDFQYISDTQKLGQMASEYNASITDNKHFTPMVTRQIPAQNLTTNDKNQNRLDHGMSQLTSIDQVPTQTLTSEKEPDLPGVSQDLSGMLVGEGIIAARDQPSQGQNTTSIKSQDDQEPQLPYIATPFQSNQKRENTSASITSPHLDLNQQLMFGNQTANEEVLKSMQLSPELDQLRFATEAPLTQLLALQNSSVTQFDQEDPDRSIEEEQKASQIPPTQQGVPRGQETADFGKNQAPGSAVAEAQTSSPIITKIAEEASTESKQSSQGVITKSDEIHSAEVIIKRKIKLPQTKSLSKPRRSSPQRARGAKGIDYGALMNRSPPPVQDLNSLELRSNHSANHSSSEKKSVSFSDRVEQIESPSNKVINEVGMHSPVRLSQSPQNRQPMEKNESMRYHNLFVCDSNADKTHRFKQEEALADFLQSSPEQANVKIATMSESAQPFEGQIQPRPHQTDVWKAKSSKIDAGTNPMSLKGESNEGEKPSQRVSLQSPAGKKRQMKNRGVGATNSDQLLPNKKIKRRQAQPSLPKNQFKESKPQLKEAADEGPVNLIIKNKKKLRKQSKEVYVSIEELPELDQNLSIAEAQNKTTHGFSKLRRVDFSDVEEMIIQEAQSVEETKRRKSRRVHRPQVAGRRGTPSPDMTLHASGAFRVAKKKSSTVRQPKHESQNPSKSVKMPQLVNQNQSEPSQSPPRVFKTTAKNGMTEESPETLPKDIRALSLKMVQPKKLKPLDKRLAEARMNASMQHSISNGVQNYDDYQVTQDKFNEEQGASQEVPTLTAIDWGPDPEPVYSSHMNCSVYLSNDNLSIVKDSLWGLDDTPYQNAGNDMQRGQPTLIKLGTTGEIPKRSTITQQVKIRSRQIDMLDYGLKQKSTTNANKAFQADHHSANELERSRPPALENERPESHDFIDHTPEQAEEKPSEQAPKMTSSFKAEADKTKITTGAANSQASPAPARSEMRTMSNLTIRQIQEALQKKKTGSQADLGPNEKQGQTALGFMPKSGQFAKLQGENSQHLLHTPQIAQSIFPVARTANSAEWKSVNLLKYSQEASGHQYEVAGNNNQDTVVVEEESVEREMSAEIDIPYTDEKVLLLAQSKQLNDENRHEPISIDLKDVPSNKRTARRGQSEFLAVSMDAAVRDKSDESSNSNHIKKTSRQDQANKSAFLDTYTETQKTEQARSGPGIGHNPRYFQKKQTISKPKLASTLAVSQERLEPAHEPMPKIERSLETIDSAQKNSMKSITSQIIREKADKRYAAYSRKNALAMYRSIQHPVKKQSIQKGAKYEEIHHNENGVRNSRQILAKSNERETTLPEMGGLKASSYIEERKGSQILARDLHPLTPINVWAGGPVKATPVPHDYQTLQPPQAILPKLNGAPAGRSRYLIAQSHQTSLLREQSESSFGQKSCEEIFKSQIKKSGVIIFGQKGQQQSKSQLRQQAKPFNQDIEEDLQVGSLSPNDSRFKLHGAKNQRSQLLKPFIPSGVVQNSAISSSQNQMRRNPSKIISVRDPMASELSYARNGFYLHRGTAKASPKDSAPRQTAQKQRELLEAFKSKHKPPTIVALALNQSIKSKITNANAKLSANFDLKRHRKQMAKSRVAPDGVSTQDQSNVTQNAQNPKVTHIPSSTVLQSNVCIRNKAEKLDHF